MPVKRISDQNWLRLKRRAEPLDNADDDVLGRLLDIAGKHFNAATEIQAEPGGVKHNGARLPMRRQASKRTPVYAFNFSIGWALLEMGGSVQEERI